MIDGTRLAEWLGRLVQIPSVTPDQGGEGEGKLASQVADWFAQLGGEVHRHEVWPGRPNIYGIWRGRTQRWLAVDVHMDTVGVAQMTDEPFDGRIEQGRVYGRGAVDTKATLAVVLGLLEAMQADERSPADNLLIAATVDEESGATGAPAFADWLQARQIVPDQLAVAEPTQCTPIHGHKGVVRLTFHVQGAATHSSQPERGKNAVTAAAHIVLAMEAESKRLSEPSHETALGFPKLTVSLIQGGTGINVVPDACYVSIDRRVVVGEDPETITQELYDLARQSCPLPVEMTIKRQIQAFYQSPDTVWVRQLAEWSGREATVAPYGTNAWAYDEAVQERVVIGPGSIDQAHGPVEWVAIDQLEKLAHIYSRWWRLADST